MKKVFILFIFVFAFALLIPIKAATATVNMIVASPGEDSSTQVGISWHSSNASCTLSYTTFDDTSFSNAIDLNYTSTLDDLTFDDSSFYRYEADLTELTPNTKYIYTIKSGNYTSSVHSFKTGSNGGSFSFIWDSDVHAYTGATSRITLAGKLIDFAKANLGDDVPLIISTGDEVAYGASYAGWQQWFNNSYTNILEDTLRASVVGNHTYYTTKSVLTSNKWWLSMFNLPNNGLDGTEGKNIEQLNSCFWFIYNGVLFVGIDSIIANKTSGYTAAEKVWFEKVMQANEGKYQYSIVYQHYPWFDGESGSSHSYSNNYETWHELFDKYEVDLALGGDKHCYLRTKAIYENKVVEDGSKGTVYINAPQIGDRYYVINGNENANFMAKRVNSLDLDSYSGLSYFTVTSSGITQTMIDCDNKVQDSCFIPAKRSVIWGDKKEEISKSLTLSYVGSSCFLDFKKDCIPYIEKIEVINNSKTLATFNPTLNNSSFIKIDSLNKNTIYQMNIKITYVDNTVEEKTLSVSTFDYFGDICGHKTRINNNKLELLWNQSLKNDIVQEYKIFKNNDLITTLPTSISSYEFSLNDVNINDKFTLQALTSSGEVVYENSFYYNLYGDIDFNGKVDMNDLTKLLENLSKNNNFGNNEIKLIDVNNDGVVDSGDAITLLAFINDLVSTYKEYTYTVIFIDESGKILSTQEVLEGENAVLPTAPNKNGYIFSHWSIPTNGIYRNLIIRPVYEEGVK